MYKVYAPEKTVNIPNVSPLKHKSIVYYFDNINEEKWIVIIHYLDKNTGKVIPGSPTNTKSG